MTLAYIQSGVYTKCLFFSGLPLTITGCLQLLEIYWNLISFLEILEISRNLVGPLGKLQNVGGKAGIHAALVSWSDGTVMSVGRSSSSQCSARDMSYIACRRNINQAVAT